MYHGNVLFTSYRWRFRGKRTEAIYLNILVPVIYLQSETWTLFIAWLFDSLA